MSNPTRSAQILGFEFPPCYGAVRPARALEFSYQLQPTAGTVFDSRSSHVPSARKCLSSFFGTTCFSSNTMERLPSNLKTSGKSVRNASTSVVWQ